jgi:hypothetical protein
VPVKPLDFSLAYRFAESTLTAVKDPNDFGIGDVTGDFLGVGSDGFYKKISKPQKVTLLHDFIKNVNFSGLEWETGHMDMGHLLETYGPIITGAGYELPEWFKDGELEEHIWDLDELLEVVCDSITESAFHILFSDRDFLFLFSQFVSDHIKYLSPSDSPTLKKEGVVRRANYLPKWLRTAVFHRDKGRCQICTKDLTGLLTPEVDIHLDHMLPLEASGTNDPTNFQLLCESCNTTKGKKPVVRKQLVFTYW